MICTAARLSSRVAPIRASTKATVLIAEEMGSLRSSMKQAAEASQMASNAALSEAQKLNTTLMV